MNNQFRQDLVSGHWVLIAPSRAKRPDPKKEENFYQTPQECPFEDPQAHGNELIANFGENTAVYKNKFPAMIPGICGPMRQEGLFNIFDANGFHEVVITKDHEKSFAQFSVEETQDVLVAYRARYREIAKSDCGVYVSIFHNHGRTAGASLFHNHSQIISTPVVPHEVSGSLNGAENYFKKHGNKVHDVLIDWELKEKKRIVFENEHFVVLCPFVSKAAFEMRIYPKVSSPHFQEIPDVSLPALAQALNTALSKLYKSHDNPDYNFYIHTAPVDKDPIKDHDYYRWHVEIEPRIGVFGGFELSTALFINPVDPDDAAETLRNA